MWRPRGFPCVLNSVFFVDIKLLSGRFRLPELQFKNMPPGGLHQKVTRRPVRAAKARADAPRCCKGVGVGMGVAGGGAVGTILGGEAAARADDWATVAAGGVEVDVEVEAAGGVEVGVAKAAGGGRMGQAADGSSGAKRGSGKIKRILSIFHIFIQVSP